MSSVGLPVVVGMPVQGISNAPAPQYPPPLERRSTRTATLLGRGWPPGLTSAVAESVEQFPLRFVIVDNSGSMQATDGQRIVATPNGQFKPIQATRWGELGDVITELAEVATALEAPTHFHLLNSTHLGQYFSVADGGASGIAGAGKPAKASDLKAVMQTSPAGFTPLTEAVQVVHQLIFPHAQSLASRGQKVVVVLATDGLPNDPASFLHALQALQQLPVWLVVRLCTNEDSVVSYWSELDAQLEAPLETLDDVAGEAGEVFGFNPWLTYAPSLHLARTMGLHEKIFDLLDETALLPSQAKLLVERLLGCSPLPEPEADLHGFSTELKRVLAVLPPVYNPVTKRMAPWIDASKLQRHLQPQRPCILS
jgi:hypothetical protein